MPLAYFGFQLVTRGASGERTVAGFGPRDQSRREIKAIAPFEGVGKGPVHPKRIVEQVA